jgi:hypothetical protein
MSKRIQKSTSGGYRVIKKESSEPTDNYSDSDIDSDNDGYSSEGGGKYKYASLVDSNYKKPREGSRQDNFTKDQIREKLIGYKALRTSQDKEYLLKLKPFKVWVRYFNNVTKEFRVGGLLKMVDKELRYIMLVNTSKNLTWSVQLKDCIIFIPKDLEKQEQEKQKEQLTKEKLYKLYQQGKLGKK